MCSDIKAPIKHAPTFLNQDTRVIWGKRVRKIWDGLNFGDDMSWRKDGLVEKRSELGKLSDFTDLGE